MAGRLRPRGPGWIPRYVLAFLSPSMSGKVRAFLPWRGFAEIHWLWRPT